MRSVNFSLIALVVVLIGSAAAADALPKHSAAVVLRYPGTAPLRSADAQQLKAKALEILRSSNFNSAAPRWEWDEATSNLEYGAAVSGRHLLVTFADPTIIETTGGKVVVKEIIIGLNTAQYASSLHTIDDKGRVVAHAKYSGTLCVELVDMVKALPRESAAPRLQR
ncbi:MAG TPA: hypothetical protein VGD45_14855 [Steroidobacter sp.]|uniref:hypothetical protein n=1 Tax=Steroidobacter sp. TaxID=1978227 RepID=UPI002EDB5F6F